MATKPSKEYTAFDALMGQLLTVPKTVLKERMDAHKAASEAKAVRPGPKRKVRPPGTDAVRDDAS